MWKLIHFAITGCWHKWEFIGVNRLKGDFDAVGQRVISKCTKCGTYRKQDLI